MKKKIFSVTGLALLILLWADQVPAKGLSVEPAVIRWQLAADGEWHKCPDKITIINRSDAVRSYTLRVVQFADLTEKHDPVSGPLPDRTWITFYPKRVAVGPWQEKDIEIDAAIPDLPIWRGCNWDFFIEVVEYSEGGEVFSLACYPRVCLATKGGGE